MTEVLDDSSRRVAITLPGDRRAIGVVRLFVGGLAARLDLGYDPTGTVNYPLLAQRADGTFVNLGEIVYDPYGNAGGSVFNRFRHRLQLQFSFGQPF